MAKEPCKFKIEAIATTTDGEIDLRPFIQTVRIIKSINSLFQIYEFSFKQLSELKKFREALIKQVHLRITRNIDSKLIVNSKIRPLTFSNLDIAKYDVFFGAGQLHNEGPIPQIFVDCNVLETIQSNVGGIYEQYKPKDLVEYLFQQCNAGMDLIIDPPVKNPMIPQISLPRSITLIDAITYIMQCYPIFDGPFQLYQTFNINDPFNETKPTLHIQDVKKKFSSGPLLKIYLTYAERIPKEGDNIIYSNSGYTIHNDIDKFIRLYPKYTLVQLPEEKFYETEKTDLAELVRKTGIDIDPKNVFSFIPRRQMIYLAMKDSHHVSTFKGFVSNMLLNLFRLTFTVSQVGMRLHKFEIGQIYDIRIARHIYTHEGKYLATTVIWDFNNKFDITQYTVDVTVEVTRPWPIPVS